MRPRQCKVSRFYPFTALDKLLDSMKYIRRYVFVVLERLKADVT